MWECQVGEQDGEQGDDKMVEHGIFPSTKEASVDDAITFDHESSDEAKHGIFPSAKESSDDAPTMALTFGGEVVEEVEHGSFPSTLEAFGVENIEPTLMCLTYEMVPISCENESHLAHLSESESELSASTICEFECFHFEGMSDTPLELREVVDRSCEAISISNNLTSTSSVFSHCVLGSMDDDDATPCLLQDEQVVYMEAPTTSTPTSHERDYKGMGVDVTMIPLVDMMNYGCLHAMDDSIDVTYDSFFFPCDTLFETNVDHVESPICDNFAMSMPCFECFHFSPIVACNMLNNFSFTCVVCNNVDILAYEIAPIAFSPCGDFSFSFMDLVPSFTLHSDHPHISYFPFDFGVVGVVQMKRRVMMDDVFIYRAHNFFLWCLVCAVNA